MRKKTAIEMSKCLDDISSGIEMIGNFKDNKYVVSKVEKIFKESLLKLDSEMDDIGKEKSEAVEKQRARQNVVYEAGYFMGKLGRERVIMLVDNGIELPSDLQGVVYTDSESWKTEVLQELQSIGYAIDFNKLFKR